MVDENTNQEEILKCTVTLSLLIDGSTVPNGIVTFSLLDTDIIAENEEISTTTEETEETDKIPVDINIPYTTEDESIIINETKNGYNKNITLCNIHLPSTVTEGTFTILHGETVLAETIITYNEELIYNKYGDWKHPILLKDCNLTELTEGDVISFNFTINNTLQYTQEYITHFNPSNNIYFEKNEWTTNNTATTNILKTFKFTTNKEGIIHKTIPRGEYSIHAEYNNDNKEYYTSDSDITIQLNNATEEITINLYRCENETLLNKTCKYFLHDPYMTPNNYDLYFDYSKIPVNNKVESPHDLRRRLQRTLPLTKILHLNLETSEEPEFNTVHLHTKCKLTYTPLTEDPIIYNVQATWDIEKFRNKLTTEDINTATESYNQYIENIGDNIISKTLEDFINEIIKQKYCGEVEVYVVRVKGREVTTVQEITLNKNNNWQTYTNPLSSIDTDGTPVNYDIQYTVSDCIIQCTPTSTSNMKTTTIQII